MTWISYLPILLQGALLTLTVAVSSLALAVVLGLVFATMKLSASRALQQLAMTYTTVMRGVPDIVMMLLIYYGGQFVVNQIAESQALTPWDINPAIAGTLTIGFIYGSFFAETFRGAFQAIPHGQRESGAALGMGGWQTFRIILLPQMVRFAIPGIGNNWLVLLKSTAIVSMIGLADVTWLADQAGRSTGQPFLFYILVCIIYMCFSLVSELCLARLNRRFSLGVRVRHQP